MNILKFTHIALVILTINITVVGAQESSPNTRYVPNFNLFDINGNEVSLEDHRGKVVLINFWATYCAPCIEEMPTMDDLKQSLSDKPFEILAINMGEDINMIKAFMKRLGFNFAYPLLLDPGNEVAREYKVKALPATLVIDKNGEFVFGGIGARNWNDIEIRNQILPLLEQ